MTRLIDADALMDYLTMIPIDLGYREVEEIVQFVNETPTVDAIPVEWIEEWCISQDLTYIKIAVEKLFDDWREENDKTDRR